MKRVCSICKIEKDLEDFYKSKIEKLGREYRCKECASKKMKKYIGKDPEGWKKRSKVWREKKVKENPNFYKERYIQFKESNDKYQKKNRDKNKIKHQAHAQVYWDLLKGKISKPETCENCMKVPKNRLEAHHPDYNEPKNIIWLCKECHVLADKLRKLREQK